MKMEINKPLEEVVRTLMKLKYEPTFWDDDRAELVRNLDKQKGRFHCKMNSLKKMAILDLHEDRIVRGYRFASSYSKAVKRECQRIQRRLEQKA